MASDNTISESLARTSTSESDNINSELLAHTSIPESDDTVSELAPRAGISNSDNVCRFFDLLPLELRHKIYDFTFHEEEFTGCCWHYKIRTSLPKARLVSRQLTMEYDARENDKRPVMNSSIEASECELADFDCPCTRIDSGAFLGSLASRTTAIHINLVVCQDKPINTETDGQSFTFPASCRLGLRDLLQDAYEDWIKGLIDEFLLLEKMTMSVSCGNMRSVMTLQSSHDAIWPDIPQLTEINLLSPAHIEGFSEDELFDHCHDLDKEFPHHSADFYEDRGTMATWTLANGWQTDVKETEKARNNEIRYLNNKDITYSVCASDSD
jgi:hypothetical protein